VNFIETYSEKPMSFKEHREEVRISEKPRSISQKLLFREDPIYFLFPRQTRFPKEFVLPKTQFSPKTQKSSQAGCWPGISVVNAGRTKVRETL
jgi:hypothetical protein